MKNNILKNTLDFVVPKKKSVLGKYEQCLGTRGQHVLLKHSHAAFPQGQGDCYLLSPVFECILLEFVFFINLLCNIQRRQFRTIMSLSI